MLTASFGRRWYPLTGTLPKSSECCQIKLASGDARGGRILKKIFKITVTKWNDHNKGHKRSFKKTMISNNFCSDAKLCAMPLSHRWLFLSLLLMCGNDGRDTIEIDEKSLRKYLESSKSTESVLSLFQSLQILTWEILNQPLIEVKRSEKKLSEVKGNETGLPKQAELIPAAPVLHPLMVLWNEHRGKLPEARSCIGSRLTRIKARWSEQTPEAWAATIKRMSASDFCNGKNTSGWRADFDFLSRPDTWAKVNEGKYDNGNGFKTTAQTAKYDNLDALEKKWAAEAGK